jgi:hypothetical protein
MATSSNSSMMSTIDSLKDKMSDEVYLALCEKMKELHTEDQQVVEPTMIPVRIWFMTVRTFYVDEDGERYRIDPAQKIVMMTRDSMESMKRIIDNSPMHSIEYSFDNPVNRFIHEERYINDTAPISRGHVVKVYRVEEI